MFSIQTMRYICVINQEKSFSKAAQKLYVSQSWLSVAVKKEEEEKNPVLFKLYEYLKTIKKTSTKKAKG